MKLSCTSSNRKSLGHLLKVTKVKFHMSVLINIDRHSCVLERCFGQTECKPPVLRIPLGSNKTTDYQLLIYLTMIRSLIHCCWWVLLDVGRGSLVTPVWPLIPIPLPRDSLQYTTLTINCFYYKTTITFYLMVLKRIFLNKRFYMSYRKAKRNKCPVSVRHRYPPAKLLTSILAQPTGIQMYFQVSKGNNSHQC